MVSFYKYLIKKGTGLYNHLQKSAYIHSVRERFMTDLNLEESDVKLWLIGVGRLWERFIPSEGYGKWMCADSL